MKKILIFCLSILVTTIYTKQQRWCQPDEEKPRQAFDYFIGGDDKICYVKLSQEAKDTLKKMLDNAKDEEKITQLVSRIQRQVHTPAGREAHDALKEMAHADSELRVGVIKDGIFGGGAMMKKAYPERS